MTKLLLIDPNSGNPFITTAKKISKNAKAEDYINILILFVHYNKNISKQVNKAQLKSDCRSIVKELYRTYPFNAFRDRVNIFTPRIQPDLGVVYSPTDEMGGFAFKKSIENKVKLYNYQSFIIGGDVWLWNQNSGSKRSYGCVGIVSGDLSQKRSSFKGYTKSPASRPKQWAINLGAIKQSISYFLISSKKHGESRIDRLSEKFIHELGHGLNLADEYEKKINKKNDGIWTDYKGQERPNVISSKDIWKATAPFTLDMFPGMFPPSNYIDPTKIPWEIMLGDFKGASPIQKSKLLKLRKHKSRAITEAECDALIEGGPFTYDKTHGWCPKNTPRNRGSKTTIKSASTELDIGLYEGGDTKSFNIFRPQKNCRMRHSGVHSESYCWVCQKWILYRVSAPVFKQKISSFKIWLKQDLELHLAMELEIRNSERDNSSP